MPVYNPSGSGNVHVDQVLTNISLGYSNQSLVGENLFPSVPVRKQADKYYTFGRESFQPELNDVRTPGALSNEIPGFQVSTDTYYAVEHSLQIAVTDEERENADPPLAPDRDGTELVTDKILIGREKAIKDLATTAANYATGFTVTLAGGQQWSDYANSNPIADVKTGKRKVNSNLFMDPNVGIFPYEVMSQLEDHPDIIERIKYSERGILTSEIIASVFGLQRIIVPGAGIGSGLPAQTITVGYLWGKDVVLAWVPPRPGLKMPAYGYEFTWGYGGARTMVTDRWREDPRKSDLIRTSRRYDLKMVGVDATAKSTSGYLIKAAVA